MAGDILYSTVRPNLQNFGIITTQNENLVASSGFCVLRPKTGLHNFIMAVISSNSFTAKMVDKAQGGVFPAVNQSFILEQEIPYPPEETIHAISSIVRQADKSKFDGFKSQFLEMQMTSSEVNTLGDFIERITPTRCGNRELPVLSVTKAVPITFQTERFDATVVSKDQSNYIVVPRGYLVQGIHIDESNFGIQNLVDEGIVSPAYKLWRFKNDDAIPKLIEYYLRSEMAIEYFTKKFVGSTVPRRQVIPKEDFLALPLNFPKIDEQKKFFDFFQQADKSKYYEIN